MAAVLAGAVAVAGAVPRAGAFTVAVLRRDGLIVPFATWDGKHWRADWPRPEQNPDVPISLDSVPTRWWGDAAPAGTWRAWTDQPFPQTVGVRQPDWFKAQCLRQIGLRTDYRGPEPPPPPTVQPYPKDGLALSSSQPVDRIDIVPTGVATDVMLDAFENAESRLLDNARFLPEGVPRDPVDRTRVPLTIEASYAFGKPPAPRYYYLEMSREYDRRHTAESCAGVAFGAGWFVRGSAGDLKALSLDVSLADCDRYGLAYMLPLGVARLNGHIYWIAQWSGWDYERYGIVELTPKRAKPILTVYGGSC
ncbi:MAG: hypothetical protein ACM3SQ_18235 [Betaproteobacteria bacterium]